MRGVALLSSLVLATAPGCALFASANRAHSRISSGCNDEPGFAYVDLVLAGLGTGVIMASGTINDSPAWMVLPGVFFLSGLIGAISAHSCRDASSSSGSSGPPVIYDYVPSTNTPLDPDVREATPEELGLPLTTTPAKPLKLDPDFKPPPPPSDDKRIKCSIEPLTECPDRHSCVLVESNSGFCVADPEVRFH